MEINIILYSINTKKASSNELAFLVMQLNYANQVEHLPALVCDDSHIPENVVYFACNSVVPYNLIGYNLSP